MLCPSERNEARVSWGGVRGGGACSLCSLPVSSWPATSALCTALHSVLCTLS
ncbi:hypothetical protein BDZ91DRAFT_732574, partial [Kalaharituber pfeilii]